MGRRILVWLGQGKIPVVFEDWYALIEYIREETGEGRPVTIHKLEYV